MTTTLPNSLEDGDQLLLSYLLGLLGPADIGRLDEASITDDELAARLRTVEEDLIDAYVRSALAGETLTRFESRYLTSPRRREQIACARLFVAACDRPAPHQGPKAVR